MSERGQILFQLFYILTAFLYRSTWIASRAYARKSGKDKVHPRKGLEGPERV
jgi:hypothetical protein